MRAARSASSSFWLFVAICLTACRGIDAQETKPCPEVAPATASSFAAPTVPTNFKLSRDDAKGTASIRGGAFAELKLPLRIAGNRAYWTPGFFIWETCYQSEARCELWSAALNDSRKLFQFGERNMTIAAFATHAQKPLVGYLDRPRPKSGDIGYTGIYAATPVFSVIYDLEKNEEQQRRELLWLKSNVDDAHLRLMEFNADGKLRLLLHNRDLKEECALKNLSLETELAVTY